MADGVVYVGSAGGWLHALDRADGRELWRYRTGAPAHGSPAVLGTLVFITDMAGTLHAVDRATGTRVWSVRAGAPLPWPWGHESGDVFASSPTLSTVDGRPRVFWGAPDGVLRAADPATGEVAWSLPTEGRIRSTPAVAGGRVVGSGDGRVYCADAGSGTLHVGARDGWLYALDLSTGKELWSWDDQVSWVNGSPAVVGGRVLSGTSDRRWIHALDAATGEELWRITTDNIVWTSPVVIGATAPPRWTTASSSSARKTGGSTRCVTAPVARCAARSSGIPRR